MFSGCDRRQARSNHVHHYHYHEEPEQVAHIGWRGLRSECFRLLNMLELYPPCNAVKAQPPARHWGRAIKKPNSQGGVCLVYSDFWVIAVCKCW